MTERKQRKVQGHEHGMSPGSIGGGCVESAPCPSTRAGLLTERRSPDRPSCTFVLHADGAAPAAKNRAWCLTCELEIPDGGASGPIAVVGGESGGWSLYMNRGVATFCYNFDGVERTYIRAKQPLGTRRHSLRLEFEVEDWAGTARLFVDHDKVAEGAIPRTMAFAYSLDETFNIGSDKGTPVTHEYAPLAAFSGKIVGVTVDLGGY